MQSAVLDVGRERTLRMPTFEEAPPSTPTALDGTVLDQRPTNALCAPWSNAALTSWRYDPAIMLNYITTSLREHPELAIFLTLSVGFVLGGLKFRSFTLGNVVGTLLAGLLIGQLGIEIPSIVKTVFFSLFMFATGYKVGPQFIRGLGKNALPQVALTLVFCATALAAGYLAAKLFGYDSGTAAGLMAGAYTTSSIIGTSGDAINGLGLPKAETTQLLNAVPVAYAVSYLVGTTGAVFFLSAFAPRLLRVDLKAESKKLEDASGKRAEGGPVPAYREWVYRSFRVGDAWAGKRVTELEQSFEPERVFVERIRSGSELRAAEPDSQLAAGDVIAVGARHHIATTAAPGEEVEDRELLEFPIESVDVVLTNKALVNRTIADLAEEFGRGVVLRKLVREGEVIPFEGDTRLDRGDQLRIAGAVEDVARAGKALGYIERSTTTTDIVFVGLGIVIGGLVGLLSIKIGSVPLTLTASGGALIMGLVFGWLRSIHPTFGRIPEPALWIFDTLGLTVFIAVVGLEAGPGFVDGLKRTGLSLLFVGLAMVLVGHLVALLFGRFVLKMNPVILLGACAGAGTCTPALRAVQDAAQSTIPVLGYTVPYAIASIVLAAWGPVIVLLTR